LSAAVTACGLAGPGDQSDVVADQLGIHHRRHAAERAPRQRGEHLIIDAAFLSVNDVLTSCFWIGW
jgi:hypothetical protein